MPNGYLKHSKAVGRKQARGGSSKKGYKNERTSLPPRKKEIIDDFTLEAKDYGKTVSAELSYPTQECAICFETCPVLCLSNKCQWHDNACFNCLRRVLVVDPQKQAPGFITKYPLQCFHPLCNQSVQASQLKKHGLFYDSIEVRKHHEMLVYAKVQKAGRLRTVLCPACRAPKCILPPAKDKTYSCFNCKAKFDVSPDYATIKALERFRQDSYGPNDGWCRCPNCSILISKGDGCSHMECLFCYHEFDWDEVKAKMHPLCDIPEGEIHHWW
jgi:hypothetical protein